MKHIIYKVTNNKNGKFYIGAHSTNNVNDSYFGSGKVVLRALKKHGVTNFTKDVLFIFDNKEDMFDKEREIVTEDFVKNNDNYNMVVGGSAPPVYQHTDESRKRVSEQFKGVALSDEHKEKISKTKKKVYHPYRGKELSEEHKEKNRQAQMGRKHSEETKQKMRNKKTGKNNPNYGKKFSREYREKLGNAHKGLTHSEETKQKQSMSAMGNQNAKGYARTKEHIQKIAISLNRTCINCAQKIKRQKRNSPIYVHRSDSRRECEGMSTFAE